MIHVIKMNNEQWNELQEYLPILSELNLDICYLYITETGFDKNIIDATTPVSNFLKKNNIHDFDLQEQGPEFKVLKKSKIILNDSILNFETSLYRPISKKGDNRLWFRGISKKLTRNHFGPESFIALTANKNYIYVLNLSDESVLQSISNKGFVYQKLLEISKEQQNIANELLNKIKNIHDKGFIPTVTEGDTGIGMTLEHELGIEPNSSKKPDYKGIELKTYRTNEKKKIPSRTNLFSKVPKWKNSKCKSSKELLDEFGYWDDDEKRIELNTTIKANFPNKQGFYLKINQKLNKLYVIHKIKGEIIEWDINELKNALLKKHHETFWIAAENKMINGIENFKYVHITHTKNPQINLFEYLIESRVISLDFVMHITEKGSARDHGYLFKINKTNLDKLFPKIIEYDLTNL